MIELLVQGLGALMVAVLAFYGFRGGLSVQVRGVLALALVVVWFFLSPVFFPLMALR